MRLNLKQQKVLDFRKKKQRGGNDMFYNDPKQLLKKLELIVVEILADNTSIGMRNMGVSILDTAKNVSNK